MKTNQLPSIAMQVDIPNLLSNGLKVAMDQQAFPPGANLYSIKQPEKMAAHTSVPLQMVYLSRPCQLSSFGYSVSNKLNPL